MDPRSEPTLVNKQVLLEYLDLYSKQREPHAVGLLQSYYSNSITDKLGTIVASIRAEIETAKTNENWINLIFKCREEAINAQLQKMKPEASLLFETLHGLASLIICQFKGYDFKNTLNNDKAPLDAISKEIDKLNAALTECRSNQKICFRENRGINIESYNDQEKKLLLKTAYLCDPDSFNEAKKQNLFPSFNPTYLSTLDLYVRPTAVDTKNYNCSESANYGHPLFLQEQYCKWLFDTEFKPKLQFSFSEFIEKAIKNGSAQEQAQEALRREHQLAQELAKRNQELAQIKLSNSNHSSPLIQHTVFNSAEETKKELSTPAPSTPQNGSTQTQSLLPATPQ